MILLELALTLPHLGRCPFCTCSAPSRRAVGVVLPALILTFSRCRRGPVVRDNIELVERTRPLLNVLKRLIF